MAVLTTLEGKDGMGDTGTAGRKSTHFITSHIQLDEHHNAVGCVEHDTKNIYSKYKFTIYKQ